MIKPLLKIENVSKKVSDLFSLKDISLELHEGEVLALLGENGSGKTTLMNIVCGNISADSGNFYLNGDLVKINSSAEAKNYGIIKTSQEPVLFDNLTIAENVYFDHIPYKKMLFLKVLDINSIFVKCNVLFKRIGLDINCHKPVRKLNPAQKQIVEMVKAYISEAKIIMMDEPTASLTEFETQILFNIIRELKSLGISVIYISHRIKDIKQICDRVAVMKDGRLVGTERSDNLDTFKLINMMTGIDIHERYPKLQVKTGTEILKVEDLSTSNSLKNISFSLYRKEILGITGLVGSGKTKIAKSIFGVEKIKRGEFFLHGSKISINSPVDAINFGIGYVSEDRHLEGLISCMNIYENITLSSINNISNASVIDTDKEKELASIFVQKLGVKASCIMDDVTSLSDGNQQKIMLSRWMMSKSKILILDEPTKGIDVASKVDVYNVMNDLITKGVSIILISSDIEEIIGMCDRVVVLNDGEIAAILPKNQINQEKIMYYATGSASELAR